MGCFLEILTLLRPILGKKEMEMSPGVTLLGRLLGFTQVQTFWEPSKVISEPKRLANKKQSGKSF